MIPDDERLALQNHFRRIEEYEQKELAEKERLAAPFSKRHQEIFDRSNQATGPADGQGVFTARGMTHEETSEIFKDQEQIESALNLYAMKNNPMLKPWDTPRAILETIEKLEFHWSPRMRELLEIAGISLEEAEWRQRTDAAAKDAYREIYKRLMGFVSLAPSILDDIPEAHDPRNGIEQIRAWCVDVTRQKAPSIQMIRQLVSKVDQSSTASKKGKALEGLLIQLLETVPGFTVFENRLRTQTEEIDIVVLNNSTNPRWKNDGPLILFECKNWSKKCGKNELVQFKPKMENRRRRCKLGVLIAWNGFAKTVTKELLRSSGSEVVIVQLTGKDIRGILAGQSFESILELNWHGAVSI